MTNTTTNETTGTVYYPRGERVVLKREGVARYLAHTQAMARAASNRGPTNAEREMGWEARDVREYADSLRAECARLEGVLAAIDAGLPELPANLYP